MLKPYLNIVEISHGFNNNNTKAPRAYIYTGSEGCLQVQNEVALHQFMFAYRQVNYE